MEMAGLGEEVAGDDQAVDMAGPSRGVDLVQAVECVFGVLSVEQELAQTNMVVVL